MRVHIHTRVNSEASLEYNGAVDLHPADNAAVKILEVNDHINEIVFIMKDESEVHYERYGDK